MRCAIIIQARMSSERLPGKVLTPLLGRPVLGYMIERVRRAFGEMPLVVATSTEPSDNAVEVFCNQVNVDCHRGPLDDVAARFIQIVQSQGLDAFVRLCGDSPLFDPAIARRVLALYESEKPDIATTTFRRSFPKGQSAEVVNASAFLKAYEQFSEAGDFEHVTRYFYRNPERFRIANLSSGCDLGETTMALDTAEDLQAITRVLQAQERPHWDYGWQELTELFGQAAPQRGGEES